MLEGEYNIGLDDKGRILIPTRLRTVIAGEALMITRGIDSCLWLFPTEEWRTISDRIMKGASPMNAKARSVLRRIIAPAQSIGIDKVGRINIPHTMQEIGRLKKDCILLGIQRYLELWDKEEYERYLDTSEEDFQTAAEELGGSISF